MKFTKRRILIALNLVLVISLALLVPVFNDALDNVRIASVQKLTAETPEANTVKLQWSYDRTDSYFMVSMEQDGKQYGDKVYKTFKNEFVFNKLPNGHRYNFYVWAVRNNKESRYKTATCYIKKHIYAPVITGKSDGYRRIDLNWEKVPEADGYTISETNLATGAVSTEELEPDVTSISFYDKAAGNRYEYKIQSYVKEDKKRRSSDWSESVTVTAERTIIGQASSDTDGKAGDGSGREVATGSWAYSSSSSSYKNWTYVFRLKDKEKALAAADMMEKAIANNNIGYCSNGNKVYGANACQKLAARVDYDLSKITTKTGCSCGDIVTLCVISTGTDCPYVGSGVDVARALLARPDDFECFSDLDHVANDAYLERGDILVSAHSSGKNNHVVMVL